MLVSRHHMRLLASATTKAMLAIAQAHPFSRDAGLLTVVAKSAAMFDDLPHNLKTAHELGMTTVQALWFRADEHPDGAEPDHQAFTQLDVLNVARRLAD